MLVPRPARGRAPPKGSPGLSPENNTQLKNMLPNEQAASLFQNVTASWHHPGTFPE